MKILFARHNGLGDIIMAVPLMALLVREGHQITLETTPENFAWVSSYVDGVKCGGCDLSVPVYEDSRQSREGYDHYVNLNRAEAQCLVAWDVGIQPISQQHLFAILVRIRGLPTPTNLSPGDWTSIPNSGDCRRDGQPLIFTKATGPARTLDEATVGNLRVAFPDAVIDPVFPNRETLIWNIRRAKWILGTDSGPVHAAELTRTPWVCLHTTFSHQKVHGFYKWGMGVQSSAPASPCFIHGWCGKCGGSCISGFDVQNIQKAVHENLMRVEDLTNE